jgi:peroxiredoxin Q/BCP
MAHRPAPGEPAPAFEGVATDGSRVSLAGYRGRKLVLYFYPRDDTPHCTQQACSLRDHAAELAQRGAAVLGVSTQGESSHQAFTAKHHLNFPLLADREGKVARAYGVMGGGGLVSKLKSALGLADRVTFVIDADGRIAHVIGKPDVSRHADEVLALL